METIAILYVGRHFEIMTTVVRLINKQLNWKGVGVQTDEEAKEVFEKENFKLVLLGVGIETESEIALRIFFKKLNPNIIIVQHYGGGSGLLNSEIVLALNTN